MPIELYFLRHAVAVERGSRDFTDAERPLTPEGRRKMIQAVRGMARLGVRFEALLSSPLVRAVQTAEIVKRRLPFKGKLELIEELEPGASMPALVDLLKAIGKKSFLLVGHEPDLSSWIAGLLGCGSLASVELKKGGLCHLSLERAEAGAPAVLHGLFPPKVLRRLGGG